MTKYLAEADRGTPAAVTEGFRGEERSVRSHMQVAAVALFLLAALAGQFSFSRIDPAYAELGWLQEPRIWLIGILFVMALPLVRRRGVGRPLSESFSSASNYLAIVIGFHALLALSFLWSPGTAAAKADVLSVLLVIVLLCLEYVIARVDARRFIRTFLFFFFLASLIYAAGGFLFPTAAGTGGFSFLWGGPNVYVRVVGTGAVISLYFWRKTGRRAWLLSVPFLLFAALMSGSRGGILSLLPILLFSSLLLARNARKLVVVIALLALVTVVFLYAPMFSSQREYIEQRYPRNFSDLTEEYERSRSPWFSASLQAFSDAPLTGKGISGLTTYGYNYSHNIIMNVACEAGLLGLLLLLLSFIPVITRWRRPRAIETDVCLALGAYYLLASMASGSYYDWRFIWIFLLMYMMPLEFPAAPAVEASPGNRNRQ